MRTRGLSEISRHFLTKILQKPGMAKIASMEDPSLGGMPVRRPISPIWQHGPVPSVGVVTPVRNRVNWSVSHVKQMLAQSYPFLRIYIIDSDSTDGTSDAIRALGHPAVEVLQVASSNFWTGATNAGVLRALDAGCDYILTVNDDAIVPPSLVEKIVTSAVDNNLRIVGSVISYASEPGKIWGIGAYNDWSNGQFLQTKHANLWADTVGELSNEIVESECLCGNGTLIHKSVFEQIGLYDTKHTPHYHADTEFTLRARSAGVKAFVSTDAWIYNRFLETTDGAMITRNRRYFSLRSVNYLKSMIFILLSYCPVDQRFTAFCNYIERYISDSSSRNVSIIIRISLLLLYVQQNKKIRPRKLLSSGFAELDYCRDILDILEIDGTEFLTVVPLLLFRRSFNRDENLYYQKMVRTRQSRRSAILALMDCSEFSARMSKTAALRALLGEWDQVIDQEALRKSSDISFSIGAFWLVEGRLPSTFELMEVLARLRTHSRSELFPDLVPESGGPHGAGLCSCAVTKGVGDKPFVYMNADVLCMAQSDERARTGVFRYSNSLLGQLRTDARIALKLFHSGGLQSGWEQLVSNSPDLAEFLVDEPTRVGEAGARDIAFFPYFPFEEFDDRFRQQRQVFTLCDLFPVTNPEWFTKEATSKFLRQLRHLTAAEHIFCISAETQKNLKNYAPTLRATTSVGYLGVSSLSESASRHTTDVVKEMSSKRYILCIGTLEPRKNLTTVIQAFSRMASRGFSDVRLAVVGASGWNIDYALEASPLRERISFLGHVSDNDLRVLYGAAVCTVFPSLAEGFGLPIIESFASGTPVITSNCSSMAEIGGSDAVLVDPLDVEAISDVMIRVLNDDDWRNELSRRGLARAKEFTWERCASVHIEQFLELYRS